MGTIEAMVAAKFLKKSGLSDVVLSRVSQPFIRIPDAWLKTFIYFADLGLVRPDGSWISRPRGILRRPEAGRTGSGWSRHQHAQHFHRAAESTESGSYSVWFFVLNLKINI